MPGSMLVVPPAATVAAAATAVASAAPAAPVAPAASSSAPVSSPPRVKRSRFLRPRRIEKEPPRHGEKPYEQVVAEAFDGPVLSLSERLKLLEIADSRRIRRGDALDLIAATRRALEAKHAVSIPGRLEIFVRQYAAFAACYVSFALVSCVVMSLSPAGSGFGGNGQARASSAAPTTPALDLRDWPDPAESQVNAARIYPPFDQ